MTAIPERTLRRMAEHRTIEDQKTEDSNLLGSEVREDAKSLRHDDTPIIGFDNHMI